MEKMSFKKYLVVQGLISEKELIRLSAEVLERNSRDSYISVTLGELLCEKHILTERLLCDIYRSITGYEVIEPGEHKPDQRAIDLVPGSECRKCGLIPVRLSGDYLITAMKDPMDLIAIQRIRQLTDRKIKVCIACPSAIDGAILREYGGQVADSALEDMQEDVGDGLQQKLQEQVPEDEPASGTIRYVDSIITLALAQGASDIHIEPGENETVTRIRVDGMLKDIKKAGAELHAAIVARIKVMGNMDVTEKRIPQDGRAAFKWNNEEVDLRISSLPTIFGEKIVIRLLVKNNTIINKDALGLSDENMAAYDALLRNSSGLILMVGPTGSGKSTTMITMEKLLNKRDVNIITLEDPVEYNIEGISQVQINEKTGMTFARGLRAAMRQDPDIICVGEIRDGETAEIAMRAAITGHLVISTLHTADAVSAFERLRDMGIPGYLISSSIIGIVAQRLVRRICKDCRQLYKPGDFELKYLAQEGQLPDLSRVSRGKGCPVCNHTGYKGRRGIFEILVVNNALKRAIAAGADYSEMKRIAEEGGYETLRKDCLDKVLAGETTVEEMLRVLNTVE